MAATPAWIIAYRNQQGQLVLGPSYNSNEADDAFEEIQMYLPREGAFLIQLDLGKLAKLAGQTPKRVKAKSGWRVCKACKQSLPNEEFTEAAYDDICASCLLEGVEDL